MYYRIATDWAISMISTAMERWNSQVFTDGRIDTIGTNDEYLQANWSGILDFLFLADICGLRTNKLCIKSVDRQTTRIFILTKYYVIFVFGYACVFEK